MYSFAADQSSSPAQAEQQLTFRSVTRTRLQAPQKLWLYGQMKPTWFLLASVAGGWHPMVSLPMVSLRNDQASGAARPCSLAHPLPGPQLITLTETLRDRMEQPMPPWLHWLLTQRHRLRRERGQVGRLSAIFVADYAGAPMRSRDQALALIDAGLVDDRYALGRGFWRLTDGCQVTLIHAEDLARAQRRQGLSLEAGQHRRNLVVSGLARTELRHREIRIGEVVFDWHRVRPPCGYLDRVSGPGTAKALGRQSGHCLRVRTTGLIKVGDRVEVSASARQG